jgi:hypothetical protein
MKKTIVLKVSVGKWYEKVMADLLPAGSQVISAFAGPALDLLVRCPEDTGEELWFTMEVFRQVWVSVLTKLKELSRSSTLLVYFRGPVIDEGLLSIFPYLSIENKHRSRFFVPELCKDTRSRSPITGRVCLEFYPEDFAELAAPSGFRFFPGTQVMGVAVSEEHVKSAISDDVFEKAILERLLARADCWWVADGDFEGMTILHRDYPADELVQRLQDDVLRKYNYPVEVMRDEDVNAEGGALL